MTPANFGAVRLPFLAAAVLALLATPISSQVVEKGRTLADLIAVHPCDAETDNRIARVTDCDAADDVGDGGGAFQCWVSCDGSAPWVTQAIGGGGGAGTIDGTLTATDNLIVRTDGTGGSTIQASPLSLSDVSGVTTTLATITPAATTGATVAGQALAITASPAVASTDTAGAAAGGSVTITAGAAARNTSGNAVGGDINLVGGAAIGTSRAGAVVVPAGEISTGPGLIVGAVGNLTGLISPSAGSIAFMHNVSSPGMIGLSSVYRLPSTVKFGWSSGSSITTNLDSGFARTAAGIISTTDNAGSPVWMRQLGRVALAADFTNATATMANLTGLSTTLIAGRKYTFDAALFFADSTAAEGAAFDFDGGTATVTNFIVNCQMFDAGLLLSAESAALATDFAAATTTGASTLKCSGSFEVNAAGTFIPRAAQNSHATGTLTVKRGSSLNIRDADFN